MGLAAAALLMLSGLAAGTPLWFVLAALAVMGLGLGFFSSPNTNAIMGSVGRRQYGLATGTLATMRTVGMTLSMAAVMLHLHLRPGAGALGGEGGGEFLSASRSAFLSFALLCLVGMAASLGRGRARREGGEETSVL
jgi:MFS family permease